MLLKQNYVYCWSQNSRECCLSPLQWCHNGHDGVSITSLAIVYSTVYSGTDERKHQSSVSLAFVRGIHRWPVNSPHKWPVTRKVFPFDDVIMVRQHPRIRPDSHWFQARKMCLLNVINYILKIFHNIFSLLSTSDFVTRVPFMLF